MSCFSGKKNLEPGLGSGLGPVALFLAPDYLLIEVHTVGKFACLTGAELNFYTLEK